MPRGRGFVIQRVKTGNMTSPGVIIRRLEGRKRFPSDGNGERDRDDQHPPDSDIRHMFNALLPLQKRVNEERRLPELQGTFICNIEICECQHILLTYLSAFSERSATIYGVSGSFTSANKEYIKDFQRRKLGDLQSPPTKKVCYG